LIIFSLLRFIERACPATRPPIVGVAHIAFDVSDLAKARAFYGELPGYDEPFQVFKEDGSLLLTYFKVNDRQYIEIFPGLPPHRDERLSHIAFETTDLEALRVYLGEKLVKVPDKVTRGRDGNINFSVTDPDGTESSSCSISRLRSRGKGQVFSARRLSDRMLTWSDGGGHRAATSSEDTGLSDIWAARESA
jgi:lactoylglutathione lyase